VVLDVTTATPTLIGSYSTGEYANAVTLSSDGTKAYVTYGLGLVVLDVTTATPTLIGSYGTESGTSEVIPSPDGTKAYVAASNSGLVVLDLTLTLFFPKNDTSATLSLVLEDENDDNLTLSVDSNDTGLVNIGSYNSNLTPTDYRDINISIPLTVSPNKTGLAKVTVTVTDGNSTIMRSSFINVYEQNIYGTSGNDTLSGTVNNDIFQDSLGNDTINGSDGNDTVVYGDTQSAYTITFDGTNYIVAKPDGVDTLTNIEYLNFSDVKNVVIDSLIPDITTGLVAHYEFEGDKTDSSTNGYDLASDINDFTYGTGMSGQGAVVAAGTRLKTADNAISQNGAVTYSFWMQSSQTTAWGLLASYATPSAWSFNNALFGNDLLEIGTGDTYTSSTGINGAHLDGSWHHIVVSSDGSGTVEYYFDGVSKGTTSATLTLESNFYLGDFGGGKNFTGSLDELRIYNRALSATDIQELYNYTSTTTITLNLSNVNLTEHNITNIFIIDADNYSGTMDQNNTIGVNNAATLLQGGTTSFSENISFSNYMIAFETDMGTQDQMNWFYNHTDGDLYSTYDFANSDTNEFLLDTSTSSFSFNSNWIDTTWIDTTVDTNSTTTQGLFISTPEYAITSSEYNIATAQSFDMNSFYFIDTYLDHNNDQIINLEKIIPQINNSKIYGVEIEILDNGKIQEIENFEDTIDVASNIVSIIDNNINVAEVKYIQSVDTDTLNSLYSSNNNIKFTIDFPINSMGYLTYEKQLVDECYVWSSSYLSDYSDLNNFISAHSYDPQATQQNMLAYNRYSNTKGIVFANDGSSNIIELDNTQNPPTQTVVGTWEELTNKSCMNEDTPFTTTSVIKLNIDLGVDGYLSKAFIKNSSGIYKEGEYVSQGDTHKTYALNDIATKYLAQQIGLNSTPTLSYPITNTWTYLSLPSNMTLCTSEYQSQLPDICNSNYTIESIFSDIDMVLKYTNGWSYWEPTATGTYNMDKFGSINHKEGLLVKSEYTTTINLPLDIYNIYPESTYPIYYQGWYLGADIFNNKPSDIKTKVDDNTDFTLQYILQLDDSNDWKVYAPLNDSDVSNTIQRIDTLDRLKSFWIFIE
jgi:hypothetical protein